tara:strand:- start:834 stop:1247 length:414 start_codon:yes stop_codon:yes gene_type:complete
MKSEIRSDVLTSIQQCATPLNTLFFSEFNISLVQKMIRQMFKDKTGISIDYQNPADLLVLMRSVFIANSCNPNEKVCEQSKFMNEQVAKLAISQIETGVSQYIGYMRDIDSTHIPLAVPVNTSTYGQKIDLNDKIGM